MKRKRSGFLIISAVCSLALAALSSCEVLSSGDDGKGILTIGMDGPGSRTLGPDELIEAVTFRITCTSASEEVVKSPIQILEAMTATIRLNAGIWSVFVEAFNGSGTIIGEGDTGETPVTVDSGDVTTISITVHPLEESGNLVLAGTIEAESVGAGTWNAIITPIGGGASTAYPFSGTSSNLSLTQTGFATGYYRLQVELTAGATTILRSAPEALRIAAGQSTRGEFSVRYDILTGAPRIDFGEVPESVSVTLDGPASVVEAGTQVTISATCDRRIDSLKWYLNKQIQGGQTALNFDSGTTLEPGRYRVDLVLQTAYGPGTASAVFDIKPKSLTDIANVAQGKILVNVADPQRLSYVYRTTGADLFSTVSSDAGLSWSMIMPIDESGCVFDFAADLDSSGNTVAVWTSTDTMGSWSGSVATGVRYYYAKWSKLAWDASNWEASAGVPYSMIVAPDFCGNTMYPSHYRVSSTEILFGVGYDTNGWWADSAGGLLLTWNGSAMTAPVGAGISSITDNPLAMQVFKDASDTYFTSMDNHVGYLAEDLFANATMIVHVPTYYNGDQPWIYKRSDGVGIVYTLQVSSIPAPDPPNPFYLYRASSTAVSNLVSASSTQLSTRIVKGLDRDNPNYALRRHRTVFAIEDGLGDSHVVFQEETTNDIYRFYLDGHSTTVGPETLVASNSNLDGLAVSWNATTGKPVLLVSTHSAAGVPDIVAIEEG
jgi:hypothetical protein